MFFLYFNKLFAGNGFLKCILSNTYFELIHEEALNSYYEAHVEAYAFIFTFIKHFVFQSSSVQLQRAGDKEQQPDVRSTNWKLLLQTKYRRRKMQQM